jgi:hypothetical protein
MKIPFVGAETGGETACAQGKGRTSHGKVTFCKGFAGRIGGQAGLYGLTRAVEFTTSIGRGGQTDRRDLA